MTFFCTFLIALATPPGPALLDAALPKAMLVGAATRDSAAARTETPVAEASPFTAAALRWFSPAELAEARAVNQPRWIRALVDQLVQAALFGAFIFGGLARWLRRRCERGHWLPTTVLFAIAYFGLALLIDLPEEFWFSYLHPRAHGLSDITLARWAATTARAALIEAAGLAALAVGVFGLMRRLGDRWWIWLALPAALAVGLAGALDPARVRVDHTVTPLPAGPQREAIEATLARAGLRSEGIVTIDASQDTRAMDAFVTGQGSTRRIALYDTLARSATPRELAVVVAHELGHVHDHRPLRAAVAGLAVIPLLFGAAIALRRLKRRLGVDDAADVAGLPVLLGFVWLVTLLAAPVSNAVGRTLEARADAYALELTRDPEALRSVLLKVGRINKLDPDPPAPVVFFLLSHPPLVQRLAATEAWAAAHPRPAGRAPRPRRLTPRARAPPRPDDRRTTGR
jgi:STE24 endopeptidase